MSQKLLMTPLQADIIASHVLQRAKSFYSAWRIFVEKVFAFLKSGHFIPGHMSGHFIPGHTSGHFISGQFIPGHTSGHFIPGHTSGHFIPGHKSGHCIPGHKSGHFIPGHKLLCRQLCRIQYSNQSMVSCISRFIAISPTCLVITRLQSP